LRQLQGVMTKQKAPWNVHTMMPFQDEGTPYNLSSADMQV